MLKILVLGAGAIGCFVGGRLTGAGHDVTLLGRPPLMDSIEAGGLKLRHPTKPPQTVRPQVVTSLEALSGYHPDFLLLTVKAPSTAAMIDELKASPLWPDAISKSYVVSLQNGIGNEELLVEAFGRERIIAGTVTIPINVPEAGIIEVSKDKGGLGLASLAEGQPVQNLADALTQAGFKTPVYDDYRAMKWSKLLLNIVNNAASAILDQTPAEIVADPRLFNLEIYAMKEGLTVMAAQNIEAVKLPGYRVDWLARLIKAGWLPLALKRAILRPFLVSGRGTKMPSLHIDLTAGRASSEVGALNGAIVAAGQRLNIDTPVNLALTNILKGLFNGELDWADYKNQPDRLLEEAGLFVSSQTL